MTVVNSSAARPAVCRQPWAETKPSRRRFCGSSFHLPSRHITNPGWQVGNHPCSAPALLVLQSSAQPPWAKAWFQTDWKENAPREDNQGALCTFSGWDKITVTEAAAAFCRKDSWQHPPARSGLEKGLEKLFSTLLSTHCRWLEQVCCQASAGVLITNPTSVREASLNLKDWDLEQNRAFSKIYIFIRTFKIKGSHVACSSPVILPRCLLQMQLGVRSVLSSEHAEGTGMGVLLGYTPQTRQKSASWLLMNPTLAHQSLGAQGLAAEDIWRLGQLVLTCSGFKTRHKSLEQAL